jgi:hypothetical protein
MKVLTRDDALSALDCPDCKQGIVELFSLLDRWAAEHSKRHTRGDRGPKTVPQVYAWALGILFRDLAREHPELALNEFTEMAQLAAALALATGSVEFQIVGPSLAPEPKKETRH